MHLYIFRSLVKEANFHCLIFWVTTDKLPVESFSMDIVILIWQSLDCPTDQLVQEILRVLKAGGTTLIRKPSQSTVDSTDKVIFMPPVHVWSYITNILVLVGSYLLV